jgi:hypothetical protein
MNVFRRSEYGQDLAEYCLMTAVINYRAECKACGARPTAQLSLPILARAARPPRKVLIRLTTERGQTEP